jgi:hypothetical protein
MQIKSRALYPLLGYLCNLRNRLTMINVLFCVQEQDRIVLELGTSAAEVRQ